MRRICGETTLRNVVLATNMWGNVNVETGAVREQQLAAEFVKPALDKGARLHRHYDTTESAHQIIRAILENHREALQVQRELVDEKREFDRTTVGEEITQEVDESTRRLQKEIDELQNALETVRGREKETRSELEAEIADLRENIGKLTNESKNMNKDYRKKKTDAKKRFAFLFTPAGFSISCMLLGALCYCFLF